MPRIPRRWSRKPVLPTPRIPRRWSRKLVLPTPELAESEANAFLGRGQNPEPTEAEQALAIVAPQTVHPVTGLARPWEPQPNETAAEYVAFQFYLLGDAPTPNHPLARRMAWEQRKVAHKACGEDLMPVDFQVLTERCLNLAFLWCFTELSKHVSGAVTNPQPGASVNETLRAYKDLALLARLLRGQSTENVAVKVGADVALDYSRLSDEEFALAVQLENKAKGQIP